MYIIHISTMVITMIQSGWNLQSAVITILKNKKIIHTRKGNTRMSNFNVQKHVGNIGKNQRFDSNILLQNNSFYSHCFHTISTFILFYYTYGFKTKREWMSVTIKKISIIILLYIHLQNYFPLLNIEYKFLFFFFNKTFSNTMIIILNG